jgi:hypothetical protein
MKVEDFIGKKVSDFDYGDYKVNVDPSEEDEDFVEYFKEEKDRLFNKTIDETEIAGCDEDNNTFVFGEEGNFVIIKDGQIVAHMSVYEGVNPSIHYPVVIISGHDDLWSYNVEDRSFKQKYIR